MRQRASIWQQTAEWPGRGALPGDLDVEVAVIGAGMAGVLIAQRLRERGVRAVVLEAARTGGGQTGRTTAKITSQHGLIYGKLLKNFGPEVAAQYARANEWAVRAYGALVRARNIDCDFREVPAYLFSEFDAEPLRAEAEAARRLGIDAAFTADTELPFPIAGALRFGKQARFHPLRFLYAIAGDLEIYEDTRVRAVEGDVLRTDRGAVHAGHVVFATHYPFVNVPGGYFLRMHQERSYVLALESAWQPEGVYLSAEADGLSLRAAEGKLLFGGGAHRTGENRAGGRYGALRDRAQRLFPDGCEVACWSAQDCIALDGVPYIGRFSASRPNWYVATGFAKWGMTASMVAAELISGMIAGDPPEWAAAFDPGRFEPAASAKNLAAEAAQAVKGLSKGYFGPPRAALDALPAGHGGIVEVEGRKHGVYKDMDGACHVIDPRCPHLGCQLEWNPDELSWDCPCHGSRFDCDGRLIDNPAQTDLRKGE